MRRALAVRLTLAAALVPTVLTGLVTSSTAYAQYPEFCFVGVEDVSSRGLVVVPEAADRAVLEVVARTGGKAGRRAEPVGLREVVWASSSARDAGLAALSRIHGVQAEPEHLVHAHRASNDPRIREQWGLDKIGARRAWDVETGTSNPVTVAVLDTGVDFGHPDLRGRVDPGPNVAYGTEDSQDDHMHGTHVAGIIAASTNNRLGVAGMSWGARIMAVKVLNDQGSGTSCDIAVGILEAAKRDADIINMSLGGASICPLAFRAVLAYAEHQGTMVIASAGNDGYFASPQSAPANCPGVMGVGATDKDDQPSSFTTFGSSVDVAAPGHQILSTYFDPKKNLRGYAAFSGTSMAAPFVAGLAALLRSQNPTWTPAQVSDRILATVDDVGPRGRDDFYGAGRINAARALGR
ncbi:MAG TPA: S8 family peptidase [Mycobacteriales bacterium]|nr:S8 family peptidase [Mycobacteriales bacterium]